MVNWPEPMTISNAVRELKDRFISLLGGEEEEAGMEKAQELNYIVAVSSGKAVTEEIPKQIGRRAGWASQQGANFVEILIENPAQLIMDQDMLVNLAERLNLHYNVHTSTNLAYGMSYRVGRGNGYDRSHEYTVNLFKSIRRFRNALQGVGILDTEFGIPRMYGVNCHMAVAEFPPEEERMATDVSVDPWGRELQDSRIFESREARLGIWKYFIWDYQGAQDDVNEFASILGNIEEVDDAQDYINANMVRLLSQEGEHGYINDDLVRWLYEMRQQDLGAAMLDTLVDVPMIRLQDVPETVNGLENHVSARQLAQAVAQVDPYRTYEAMSRNDLIETIRQGLRRVRQDKAEDLQQRLQELASEEASKDDIFEEFFPDLPPRSEPLDLSGPTWSNLQERAQKAILQEPGEPGVGGDAYQDVTDFFGDPDSEYEGERKPSEVMRNLARSRRLYKEEFNKESSLFRRVIPLWMPFADEPQVRQVWEGITDIHPADHEELIAEVFDPENPDRAMDDPRKEEDVVAAAAGAYVWGHFTQIPPGYEKTFLQLMEEAGIYLGFEAHIAESTENARIWKPKDMVEVAKAINETPVDYRSEEGGYEAKVIPRTRITIDMEHIATQKVDPLWVIDPDEEGRKEGYKGLDDGDGEYIMINHVTHPYIGERGHHHGPIRRGDTLVFRYLYELIDKGMATDQALPTVVMYEIGGEKTETLFMLRLILRMIEYGITPEELESGGDNDVTSIINKDQPEDLREYLIMKFFGVTDTEVQHEWQEIFEHALDPLDDLLDSTAGTHTWMGRAALQRDTRPEEWQGEEYR